MNGTKEVIGSPVPTPAVPGEGPISLVLCTVEVYPLIKVHLPFLLWMEAGLRTETGEIGEPTAQTKDHRIMHFNLKEVIIKQLPCCEMFAGC